MKLFTTDSARLDVAFWFAYQSDVARLSHCHLLAHHVLSHSGL